MGVRRPTLAAAGVGVLAVDGNAQAPLPWDPCPVVRPTLGAVGVLALLGFGHVLLAFLPAVLEGPVHVDVGALDLSGGSIYGRELLHVAEPQRLESPAAARNVR